MAQNSLPLTPENMTEWLASTGFIFPRTVIELSRFEKLYDDVYEDLTTGAVDPDVILGLKPKSRKLAPPPNPQFGEAGESFYKMAARKGDSKIPKHIMDKIKKNQEDKKNDSGSEKEKTE